MAAAQSLRANFAQVLRSDQEWIRPVRLLLGLARGPLLLPLADPGGVPLFLLVSDLVSFALIPILLTTGPTPRFDAPTKLRLWELFRISPLGWAAAIAVGVSNGAFVGMGAVYAEKIGLSVTEISFFMSVAVLGGVILQWPIDRVFLPTTSLRTHIETRRNAAAVSVMCWTVSPRRRSR